MAFGDRLRRLCKFQKEAGAMGRVSTGILSPSGWWWGAVNRLGLAAFLKAARQGDVIVVWKRHQLGRNLVNVVQDLNVSDIGIRVLAGRGSRIDTTTPGGKLVFALLAAFGGIRTRADPRTDPRWIGRCTSQGQEGKAPSRVVQCAAAPSSGSEQPLRGRVR